MIHFRCGQCNGWIGAVGGDVGRLVNCRRCGHANTVGVRPGSDHETQWSDPGLTPPDRRLPVRTLIGLVVVAGLALWAWAAGVGPGFDSLASTPGPLSAVEARQAEILKANAGRPADPDLQATFEAINVRHFAGALSRVIVRWDPALAEVGGLAGDTFTLEGMFGQAGGRSLILLNPALEGDPRAMLRALCHEMAHAYLFTTGDRTTTHGPAFKAVLHRLSSEGAFEGIEASPEERAALRAWLDAENARLDADRIDLDMLDRDIARERGELERDLADHNARVEAANTEGRSGPTAAEAQALDVRRQAFNQRVTEANRRLEDGRRALAHFNAEVKRYNLMLVYPDGLDDAPMVAPRTAGPAAGGR